MSIMKKLPLAVAVSFFAQGAMAETTLDKQVVTLSHTPEQITDLSASVWVLEQDAIQTQLNMGKDLKDVLAQLVPSIDPGTQGRTNFGQNLRGRSMAVSIDGVSLNSSRAISRQLDSIDPFNIERIEVLAGANALLGGGATGGLVNIVTKKGQSKNLGLDFKTAATSGFNGSDDGEYTVGTAISGGADVVQGRFSVSQTTRGAYYDANQDEVLVDVTQTSQQYTESLDLMSNVSVDVTPNSKFDVLVQRYENKSDGEHGLALGENLSSVFAGDVDAIENSDDLDSDAVPETIRQLVAANYNYSISDNHAFYIQAYSRSEELGFYPYVTASLQALTASNQKTETTGAKFAFSSNFNGAHVVYGLDYSRESFEATQTLFDRTASLESGGLTNKKLYEMERYAPYDVESKAAFLQSSYQVIPKLQVNAGYRFQNTETTVDDFVGVSQQALVQEHPLVASADAIEGGKTDYDVSLWNLGAVYDLAPTQQVWFGFSQGFELPDIAKYYGQGTYASLPDASGNIALVDGISADEESVDGIKTDSYELGWRMQSQAFGSQVTVYQSKSDKVVELNEEDFTINVKDSIRRTRGLEASAELYPTDKIAVGSNFHYVRTHVRHDGKWLDASAFEASPSTLGAYVNYATGAYNVQLQANHVTNAEGDYTGDLTDGQRSEVVGYTLFDLSSSFQLPYGKLSAGIANLTDRDYTTIWGQRAMMVYAQGIPEELFEYKGRGRTYSLGYSVDF